MMRYVVLAGMIAVSAVQAPVFFEKVVDARKYSEAGNPGDDTDVIYASTREEPRRANSGRVHRIKAGRGGHYFAKVRMNNRQVDVLVDTGATTVAINETTARSIGIRLKSSDFRHAVNTANGQTKMATAIIDEIRIGNIRVRDVRALVARDKALSTTLLGMSFMNKLKRFEVANRTLVLEQ